MNFSNSSLTQNGIQNYKLPVILIIISMILLPILIFLILVKCSKRKKEIKRQKVIFKKSIESKIDKQNDPSVVLLEQPNGEISHDIGIISSNDVDRIFLPNSIPELKLSDILPDTPKESTISVSSQQVSADNDDGDLSRFDLTNIPLRRLPLSTNDLVDQFLLQNSRRSSNETYEHPYITELKRQERERTDERKQCMYSQTSLDSQLSKTKQDQNLKSIISTGSKASSGKSSF